MHLPAAPVLPQSDTQCGHRDMRIGCNCIALDTGSSPIDQHKRKAFKIQKLCDIKTLEIPQLHVQRL